MLITPLGVSAVISIQCSSGRRRKDSAQFLGGFNLFTGVVSDARSLAPKARTDLSLGWSAAEAQEYPQKIDRALKAREEIGATLHFQHRLWPLLQSFLL